MSSRMRLYVHLLSCGYFKQPPSKYVQTLTKVPASHTALCLLKYLAFLTSQIQVQGDKVAICLGH